MFAWKKPVARPKCRQEYASCRLTPVPPIPPYIVQAYERYMRNKAILEEKKQKATEKLNDLQTSKPKDSKVYHAPGRPDPLATAKTIQISAQVNAVAALTEELDAFNLEHRYLEEILSLHKSMEESYVVTKQLEEDARKSWECLF
jgi:hypothetical protein